LKKFGKKAWRMHVVDAVKRLIAALEPDDVVLGGGNIHKLKVLPAGCRTGDNDNAFLGGFRLWPKAGARQSSTRARPRLSRRHATKADVRPARTF
jgi:polyphosphate glucokinase